MNQRFLIIDDHPMLRGAVRYMLEMMGEAVQTEQAGSLAEAQVILNAAPPFTLAMLDLVLPDTVGTSGLQTLRLRYPNLPILITSALCDRQTVERCLQGGAAGFFGKSSASERLAIAVRTVCSGRIYLPPEIDAQIDQRWVNRAAQRLDGDVRKLGLSDRQTEVLRLILQGMSNKLIGRQLQLAEGTVKVHVSAVLRALGVRNRTQAVLAANRLGLRLPE